MTTEAERRVIEAARNLLDHWGEETPHTSMPARRLYAASNILDAERAQPLAAPPAQADVEGLEEAVRMASDNCLRAYERWRDELYGSAAKAETKGLLDEAESDYFAALRVRDEALAAARKPAGPVLLTVKEAMALMPIHRSSPEEVTQIVLDACLERALAVIEALPELLVVHNANTAIKTRSMADISAVLGCRP